MEQTTITYNLVGGNTQLEVTSSSSPTKATKVSYQIQGDAAVNGTVTVQMQQTNVHGSGEKNVGDSAVANVSTSEFVDIGDVNGAFINFDITLGTATVGILTFTVTYK